MPKTKVQFNTRKIRKAAEQANFTSLSHAAASLRLVARRSIKKSPKASAPGLPPHTRRGRLRNAIKYALDGKSGVLIGPDYGVAADSGVAHEFGGRFRGERYRIRGFMGPALEKITPRLPKAWANSIK